MFSPRNQRNSRRALTLIELVVTGTLVVIITGILLGILIETRRTAIRGQDQLAMESHARLIADEVRSVLEASVNPASLDLATTGTGLGLAFTSQQCSLISSKGFDGKDFYRTTIQTAHDQENGPNRVEMATTVLDSARTLVPREGKRNLGLEQKKFSSTISFEYATSLDEVMERKPSYQTDLKPGEYPRIIRIRVRVEPLDKKHAEPAKQPFEIVTAIRTL